MVEDPLDDVGSDSAVWIDVVRRMAVVVVDPDAADDSADEADDVDGEVSGADFGAVRWWRLWCFSFEVLVSVSDFGGFAVVLGRLISGCADAALANGAEETAGTSSAATIAPVPSAAPTPVTAVTRRTRRRIRSRWATAMTRLVVSMSLPSSLSLKPF